eukprot:TRINITY_DN20678_c0_g1_i1.p1 TRINITY_DN20678_c0_g1~~TRINITY_DN20678_c0_g1_i1.p1  ORF type:complete len:548 (-),score=59.62 TRINITY_DN20678_c0_g1_i1:588-2231(-)
MFNNFPSIRRARLRSSFLFVTILLLLSCPVAVVGEPVVYIGTLGTGGYQTDASGPWTLLSTVCSPVNATATSAAVRVANDGSIRQMQFGVYRPTPSAANCVGTVLQLSPAINGSSLTIDSNGFATVTPLGLNFRAGDCLLYVVSGTLGLLYSANTYSDPQQWAYLSGTPSVGQSLTAVWDVRSYSVALRLEELTGGQQLEVQGAGGWQRNQIRVGLPIPGRLMAYTTAYNVVAKDLCSPVNGTLTLFRIMAYGNVGLVYLRVMRPSTAGATYWTVVSQVVVRPETDGVVEVPASIEVKEGDCIGWGSTTERALTPTVYTPPADCVSQSWYWSVAGASPLAVGSTVNLNNLSPNSGAVSAVISQSTTVASQSWPKTLGLLDVGGSLYLGTGPITVLSDLCFPNNGTLLAFAVKAYTPAPTMQLQVLRPTGTDHRVIHSVSFSVASGSLTRDPSFGYCVQTLNGGSGLPVVQGDCVALSGSSGVYITYDNFAKRQRWRSAAAVASPGQTLSFGSFLLRSANLMVSYGCALETLKSLFSCYCTTSRKTVG